MKEYFDRIFERHREIPGDIADCYFDRCTFLNNEFRGNEDPDSRSVIRNLHIRNCRIENCGLQRAIIEDCCIDNLKMRESDLLMIWGCLFQHVVLRGRFGNININRIYTASAPRDERVMQRYTAAAENYYKTVDWALDIREAQFLGLRIRGVPARLIVRDTATQAVVSQEQVIAGKWKSIDLGKSWWKSMLDVAAARKDGDVVLVAPKLDESFEVQLEGIRRLREAGIADPD